MIKKLISSLIYNYKIWNNQRLWNQLSPVAKRGFTALGRSPEDFKRKLDDELL